MARRTQPVVAPEEITEPETELAEPETGTDESDEEILSQIAALKARLKAKNPNRDEDEGEPSDEGKPPAGMVRLTDLVDIFAQGFARVAPVRAVTLGQYEPNSPFQEGLTKKQLPKMTRRYFENGRLIADHLVTPSEIKLLNQIARPGRYLDRLVEVIIREPNGPDDLGEVTFRYSNKRDNMDKIKQHARNFREMLALIFIEQEKALDREGRQKTA